MEATNLRRTANPELNEWWQEALKSRSGGFDRLLGASPGCPSLADLRAGAVSGSVFVHEISEVQPGAALDYLAAVRETRAPLLADHGHTLVGLYEVLMNDVEVVTIWASDPAGHEALMRAADAGNDERFVAWHERAHDSAP